VCDDCDFHDADLRAVQNAANARLEPTANRTGRKTSQIVKIDATENPEAADRWGVFSAPTTFVLDSQKRCAKSIMGVADTNKQSGSLKRLK